MIGFLAVMVAAGLVLGCFSVYRRWIILHRRPDLALQELAKTALVDAFILAYGLVAVFCLILLMAMDPLLLGLSWWGVLVLFSVSTFEAACWFSGIYRFAFHEQGLWYGRSWYPYRVCESYELDRNQVTLVARKRKMSFETRGEVSAEVRLRLAVEGWS